MHTSLRRPAPHAQRHPARSYRSRSITASSDSIDGYGVTDFAIGFFGKNEEFPVACRRIVQQRWYERVNDGGAAFSRPVEARLQRGLRSRMELSVGEPPEALTPDLLMERVAAVRGDEL